jgi:hypothetical protein
VPEARTEVMQRPVLWLLILTTNGGKEGVAPPVRGGAAPGVSSHSVPDHLSRDNQKGNTTWEMN